MMMMMMMMMMMIQKLVKKKSKMTSRIKKKVKFSRCGKLKKLTDSIGPQQSLYKQKLATGEGEMLVILPGGQKAAGDAAFMSCHL